MTEPLDFILEMQGVAKVLGREQAPTQEQWGRMVDMLGEVMAHLVAEKIRQQQIRDQLSDQMAEQRRLAYSYVSPNFFGSGTSSAIAQGQLFKISV